MSSRDVLSGGQAPLRLSIALVPMALVCCVLFLYQLNLAALIGEHPRTSPAGISYYGFILAVGLAAVWSLLRIPGAWQRTWPALVMTAIFAAPIIFGPIRSVEKGYVENVALFAAVVLMAQALPQKRIAYISAGITAANAALCLVDIWRPDGLTYGDSVRGAALLGNPNLAAISLLLGALIALPALPKRAARPFLVLVAAGLFATLSRSTILVTAVLIAGLAGWALVRKKPFMFAIDLPTSLTAALLVAWTAGACFFNPGFVLSISEAITGAESASFAHSIVSSSGEDQTLAAAIASIQKQAAKDGAANSITARTMLLSSGLEMARRRPLTGYGLTIAQAIAPHDTFLLFVLAFGVGGLLIPLGFVGMLTFYAWRNGRSLAIPVAIFGIMWVSHDLMLSTDLAVLLPLAFIVIRGEQI
jgi:hypothetical protein